jgi:hypothetical protein
MKIVKSSENSVELGIYTSHLSMSFNGIDLLRISIDDRQGIIRNDSINRLIVSVSSSLASDQGEVLLERNIHIDKWSVTPMNALTRRSIHTSTVAKCF